MELKWALYTSRRGVDPVIEVADGVKNFDGDYEPSHYVLINGEPVTEILTTEGSIAATKRLKDELDKAVEYLENCLEWETNE